VLVIEELMIVAVVLIFVTLGQLFDSQEIEPLLRNKSVLLPSKANP